MADIGGPFLGIEALHAGLVRKHELRSRYVALFPGVYVVRSLKPTFADRVEAAWLWSHRRGVFCGLTAARMYGSKWLADSLPIELVSANARPPKGIATSAMLLGEGETVALGRFGVTSLIRTALDLARRDSDDFAVARLDALGNAAPFDCADVLELSARHPGVRGRSQVARVLSMHNPGAQSPRETWLRLLVVKGGFPPPRTQIRVSGKKRTYYLDMGWEDLKIAIEYDGDHHRTDRAQFARDILRLEELADLGWLVIRVAADTPPDEVISRLHKAWAARADSTLR